MSSNAENILKWVLLGWGGLVVVVALVLTPLAIGLSDDDGKGKPRFGGIFGRSFGGGGLGARKASDWRARKRRARRLVGRKGTCKDVHRLYRKCKTMPLSEKAFVKMCKKLEHRDETQAALRCARHSSCGDFIACVQKAEKKGKASGIQKRWKDMLAKVAKGDYSSALTFCEVWKKDLTADMKKQCESMPADVTDALMKTIAKKRDAGKVGYKQIKCWDLKRYAKKAGGGRVAKAESLCAEIDLARDLKKLKTAVRKQLRKRRPYLPYYCGERKLKKYRAVTTPWAQKTVKKMIKLCYRRLGYHILRSKVSRMRYTCTVKDVYRGIEKYKIHSRKIDKLMKKARKKCK